MQRSPAVQSPSIGVKCGSAWNQQQVANIWTKTKEDEVDKRKRHKENCHIWEVCSVAEIGAHLEPRNFLNLLVLFCQSDQQQQDLIPNDFSLGQEVHQPNSRKGTAQDGFLTNEDQDSSLSPVHM